MDNSFYFSNILEQVFGEVVFVAAPYNNRQMETDDHDYTFYTAKISEQNYSIQRNNVALNIVKNSFGECINSMIEVSLERDILLRVVDNKWIDHLHNIDMLKEGIGLRAYGQKDPLIEYKKEAYDLYNTMMHEVQGETVKYLFRTKFGVQFVGAEG